MAEDKSPVSDKSSWADIIAAVKNPLAFFALVMLAATGILMLLAQRAAGSDLTLLIIGMLVVVGGAVLAVASRGDRSNLARKQIEQEYKTVQDTLKKESIYVGRRDADSSGSGAVGTAKRPEKYDVFLSAPMASYETDEEYKAERREIERVYDAFTRDLKLRVFWAGEKILSMADFNVSGSSAFEDLDALESSRYFVLLYPKRMGTSALFEAGYAFARGMPSLYIARREDLPFMMKDVATDFPGRVHWHDEATWGKSAGATFFEKVSLAIKNKGVEEIFFFAGADRGEPGKGGPA